MSYYLTCLENFVIKEKVLCESPLTFEATYTKEPVCPHCSSLKLHIKDTFIRSIRNIAINHKASKIRVRAHKYKCLECNKYFNTRFDGIKKYSRTSEKLKKSVYKLYNNGYTSQDIADELGIGYASVERYYQSIVRVKNKHIATMKIPKILGIDEHRFSKKVGFVTTFCDLQKHRIYDVVQGKSNADLQSFLLSLEERERVKVVCIDMNGAYKNIVKEYFPNAKIVSDRFHVVRLVNHHFSKLCKKIDELGLSYGRNGLMRLLITKQEKLSDKQKTKLEQYFSEQSAIKIIYHFIHELLDILRNKGQSKQETFDHIKKLLAKITELKKISFSEMQTLGKTLYRWREEVILMFRFSKNNGITEGFHRKMKLIQRRAYGFRNFENYRLRVRILCC